MGPGWGGRVRGVCRASLALRLPRCVLQRRRAARQEELDDDFSFARELRDRERRLQALEEQLERKARWVAAGEGAGVVTPLTLLAEGTAGPWLVDLGGGGFTLYLGNFHVLSGLPHPLGLGAPGRVLRPQGVRCWACGLEARPA